MQNMQTQTPVAANVTFIPATKVQTKGDGADQALKTLRVAAYARVSTEQEEQQSSYEAQVSYYTQYIKAHPNWEFVEVFADEGTSGTNTKRREGFNRMIDEARAGKINLILTKSISRFARNTVDTLTITRELKSLGIEVIFEKENLHTMDPKCEMMLTILSSLAQEESRSISENVRWGIAKSMQDGKTIRHIDKCLTDDGILTPGGKTVWTVSTVRSILSNEKYKGDALLQKTYTEDFLSKTVKKNTGGRPQFYVAGSHPAIIDEDTFNKAQELLKKQDAYRRKRRDTSPFSNKIICGECGEFYGHKVWHNRDNTERRDVWYCNRKYSGDEKCKTPVLDEIEIKMAFRFLLKELYKMESNKKIEAADDSGNGRTDPDYGNGKSDIDCGQHDDATNDGNGDTFDYTEARWRELVDTMTVFPDRKATFKLTDGREVAVEF